MIQARFVDKVLFAGTASSFEVKQMHVVEGVLFGGILASVHGK